MKQLISRRSFLKAAGVTTAVAAVSLGAPAASACYPGSFKDITILYTNDVHTYIDKKSPELTYAAIAALKKSYQDAGKNVLLVDAGDHIQGTAYGSMDEGASIIQLMNAAGYDVATPGNHEFDYGMARAKEVMAEADFPYLSSNWVNLPLGNRVLPDVKYFTIGGRVIAFVGITTPETFTKSTPSYFMDKSQSRYIYDILGGDDGQKLYKAVQKSIDKAKVLADYVIGLGHLGVDPSSSPWTSKEVIEHTSGFDAFIDGHSHTKMECEWVKDLSGKAVALTQTGSYFANVGEMTIKADGSIATRLISSYEGSDSAVADIQNTWVASVDDMLGEKIAAADTNFYISDPETGKRRIRMAETNLGDFVADYVYNSEKIENEELTFATVSQIIKGDAVEGYTGDVQVLVETRNLKISWDLARIRLAEDPCLSEELIQEAQGLVTMGTYKEKLLLAGERPGAFKLDNYVGGPARVGIPAVEVPHAVGVLADDVNTELEAGGRHLTIAAYLHARLSEIHPFADGNGRTARLLMNGVLLAMGMPPIVIRAQDHGAYHAGLDVFHLEGDLSPFRRFLRNETLLTWEGIID